MMENDASHSSGEDDQSKGNKSTIQQQHSPVIQDDEKLKLNNTASPKNTASAKLVTSKESNDESSSEVLKQQLKARSAYSDGQQQKLKFPQKLMEILQTGGISTRAIWWISNGTAFAMDSKRLFEDVLCENFKGIKYESFLRTLRRWGFKRLPGTHENSNSAAYFHQLFQKDFPQLSKQIHSGRENKNKKKIENHSSMASLGTNSNNKLESAESILQPTSSPQILNSNHNDSTQRPPVYRGYHPQRPYNWHHYYQGQQQQSQIYGYNNDNRHKLSLEGPPFVGNRQHQMPGVSHQQWIPPPPPPPPPLHSIPGQYPSQHHHNFNSNNNPKARINGSAAQHNKERIERTESYNHHLGYQKRLSYNNT